VYQISEIGMTMTFSSSRLTIYSSVLKNNFHESHQVIVGELSWQMKHCTNYIFLAITELSSLITGQIYNNKLKYYTSNMHCTNYLQAKAIPYRGLLHQPGFSISELTNE